MPLLSELAVASLLIFPTLREKSEASTVACRFVRYGIKQGRPDKIQGSIRRMTEILEGSPVEDFWRDPGLLVAVPGRAPRVSEDSLWVARDICKALVQYELAVGMASLLKRTTRVPPSSGVRKAEDRPSPQVHYDSLVVDSASLFDAPDKVTLVNDVVTRGSTLLACASRLKDAFPNTEVKAFALCRTENRIDLADLAQMLSPLAERISFTAEDNRIVRR